MVHHNVELLLFLFHLKGCAHVNVTVFNEHCSVAGCATNHNFRFCVSCDFTLTSFGVALCKVSMMTFCISGQQILGLMAAVSVFTLVLFCFSAGFMMVSVVVLIFNPY